MAMPFLATGLLRTRREGCIFIMPLFLLGCALGLALPGDFGEVPAKIWYLQKVEK